MQVLKQPVGLPKGFTMKKTILIILSLFDRPLKKSELVYQYLNLIWEYQGKQLSHRYVEKRLQDDLKYLVTIGQVRKPKRGEYEITYNGIVALRYLDMKWGIPKELKRPNLHDYYSPQLDDKKKSAGKKSKSGKTVKKKKKKVKRKVSLNDQREER